jgi:site-specific DNA recombinase
LLSVDEPNLDDSAAVRLLKNVLGSMSQFFSDSLSEKTKFRMAAGVKAGRWLWVAPLGYKNNTSAKVVIDSDRAPLVTKVFELLAEGSSISDVVRQVTALGLTTRKGRRVKKQPLALQKSLLLRLD